MTDKKKLKKVEDFVKEEFSVSEDLEEEIVKNVYEPYFDLGGVAVKGATYYLTVDDIADIARHFANWQKKQSIKKACEWLSEYAGNYNYSESDYDHGEEEMVIEFKKAMED